MESATRTWPEEWDEGDTTPVEEGRRTRALDTPGSTQRLPKNVVEVARYRDSSVYAYEFDANATGAARLISSRLNLIDVLPVCRALQVAAPKDWPNGVRDDLNYVAKVSVTFTSNHNTTQHRQRLLITPTGVQYMVEKLLPAMAIYEYKPNRLSWEAADPAALIAEAGAKRNTWIPLGRGKSVMVLKL